MTDLPQSLASGVDDLASAGAEKLRDGGYRVTPQRKAILAFLDQQPRHKTPQDIFGALETRVPSLSLATVYNTLELFHEIGLVKKFSDQQGQTYFDPNREPHHHAICDECGEIFDYCVSSESLEGLISTSRLAESGADDFEVQEANIWFRGACAECRRSLH